MKNRPVYAIESVDHALHLATLPLHEGPLRIADAAARLGVARSTAHRLLAMLVYRDIAERTEDRNTPSGSGIMPSSAMSPRATAARMESVVDLGGGQPPDIPASSRADAGGRRPPYRLRRA